MSACGTAMEPRSKRAGSVLSPRPTWPSSCRLLSSTSITVGPHGPAKVLADNQAVEKLLEEKGFVMTDQAHPSAQVSRYFRTYPDAGDAC